MTTNLPAFVCPCGCALQLTPRDYRDHVRLLAIVGEIQGREISIKTPKRAERADRDHLEPISDVVCVKCKSHFGVFAYIADFLKPQAMRIECSLCRRAT